MSTQRFAKSQMDTFYPEASADLQAACIVEISPQQVIIKYMTDDGLVEYVGDAEGEGHYLIRGKGFEASGTLHLADGRRLEGSWKEGQQYGMWRIYLESED
jgi:hypothetical protein